MPMPVDGQPELEQRVKVLIEDKQYHWRSTETEALCRYQGEEVMTLQSAKDGGYALCSHCDKIAQAFKSGW